MVMEVWDIFCFLSVSIARQLHLEALTVNAPLPPLMYPLPGGVLIDNHAREHRTELATNTFSTTGTSFAGASRAGASSAGPTRNLPRKNASVLFRANIHRRTSSTSTSLISWSHFCWWRRTPLWLVMLHRLLGHALSPPPSPALLAALHRGAAMCGLAVPAALWSAPPRSGKRRLRRPVGLVGRACVRAYTT